MNQGLFFFMPVLFVVFAFLILGLGLLLEYYKRKIQNKRNPTIFQDFHQYARSHSNAAHE